MRVLKNVIPSPARNLARAAARPLHDPEGQPGGTGKMLRCALHDVP